MGGMSYDKACEIVKKLKDNDISANITVGGIKIYPTDDNRQKIMDICKEFKQIPEPGLPACQEDIILRKS